jgi:hypothetical protein
MAYWRDRSPTSAFVVACGIAAGLIGRAPELAEALASGLMLVEFW